VPCLQNTMIYTNFDVLKYIKNIFKVPKSMYFECSADDSTKRPSRESEFYFFLSVIQIVVQIIAL